MYYNQHNINYNGNFVNGTGVYIKLQNDTQEILPENILDVFYKPDQDPGSRASSALFHLAADRYNFTVRYIKYSTSWGYELPNGHFTGMIGILEHDNVDVAVTAGSNTKPRLKVSTFLPPLRKWRNSYVFRQPDRFGGGLALLTPLDINVWIIIFISIPLFSFLFVMNSHLVDFQFMKTDLNKDQRKTYEPSTAMVMVVSLLTQQGMEEDLHKMTGISLRFFTLVTVEFFFFLYTYYNNEILNGLLSPAPKPIQTLEQLSQSSLTLGFIKSPDVTMRIKGLQGNSSQLAVKFLSKSKNKKTGGYYELELNDGIQMVKKGGFGFLGGEAWLFSGIEIYLTNREICSLTALPVHEWTYFASSTAKKFSPLTDIFRNGLTLSRERGLLDRVDRRWLPRKPKCLPQQFLVTVTLETVSTAFYIHLCGIILSILLAIIEKTNFSTGSRFQ